MWDICYIMVRMQIKKLVNLWLPVMVWASVIFTFSSLPTIETTKFYLWDFLLKKTAHIVEYGILSSLIYRALVNSKVDIKKSMWIAVFVSILYGASDEFHQSFTPGRGPSVRDVMIDATGAAIFIFGIVGNIKKMPEKIKQLFSRINLN